MGVNEVFAAKTRSGHTCNSMFSLGNLVFWGLGGLREMRARPHIQWPFIIIRTLRLLANTANYLTTRPCYPSTATHTMG